MPGSLNFLEFFYVERDFSLPTTKRGPVRKYFLHLVCDPFVFIGSALLLASCAPDVNTSFKTNARSLNIALYNPQHYTIDSTRVSFLTPDSIHGETPAGITSHGDTIYVAIEVADSLVTDSLQLEVALFSQSLDIGTLSYIFDSGAANFIRTRVLINSKFAHIGALLAKEENLPEDPSEAIAFVVAQAIISGDTLFQNYADSLPSVVSSDLLIAAFQQLQTNGTISAAKLDSLVQPLYGSNYWIEQWRGAIDSAQAGYAKVSLSDTIVMHKRMGRFEITQGQYASIMKETLPSGVQPGRPIRGKNFYQAALFCNALTKKSGTASDTFYIYSSIDSVTGYLNDFQILSDTLGRDTYSNMHYRQGYRLPTAEEWVTAYYWGFSSDSSYYWGKDTSAATLTLYANWNSSDISTVGERTPTRKGFFDMSGNVAEWTQSTIGWLFTETQFKYMGGDYTSGTASKLGIDADSAPIKLGLTSAQNIGWRVVKIEE